MQKMLTWIKSNPYIAGALTIVGIALIYGLFAYMTRENVRHENQLTNQGAVQERAASQQEVLNRVEKANDIERNPDVNFTASVRCKYDRSASKDCK
jgi:hypothetical protein